MGLKLICWNSRSIKNKFYELSSLIDRKAIDILLISESWLTENCKFEIPGFSSFRSDRARGGTVIFLRSSIPHLSFTKIQTGYAESCTLLVYIDNTPIRISSIYCSPAASRLQSRSFFEKVLNQPGPHIVAGDFNAKHTAWNNPNNDNKGSDVYSILNHMNYSIHSPNEPTLYPSNGSPSCVDFVVSKSCNLVCNLSVINDLSSDHLPIFFALDGVCVKSSLPINLQKANWKKFRKLADQQSNSIDVENLTSVEAIDSCIVQLSHVITDSLKCSAPRKSPLISRYKFSPAIALLTKNRNYFRNLFKRTGIPAYKSSMNQLNRMIRSQLRKEKIDAYEEKLRDLNFADNSLFRYAKSLKRKRSSIPPLRDGNALVYSDVEKAEVFARSFSSPYTSCCNSSSKFDNVVQNSISTLADSNVGNFDLFTENDVKSTLSSVNPRKSCGPDDIHNLALLNLGLSEVFVFKCTKLFNACLSLFYFPTNWKIAKILPIPKLSSHCSDPGKFRPISLLSCLGKCFEKLILTRLNDFELENKIFIQQQCGFRSEHSTIHQAII